MLELTVAAACCHQKPAVLLEHSQYFTDFHLASISSWRDLCRPVPCCGITKKLCGRTPQADGPNQRRVGLLHGCGTPRSLQIFRAKWSLISAWRGTALRLFNAGLCHHEWLPPSRRSEQPWEERCRSKSRRFIPRYLALRSLSPQRPGHPRDSFPALP